MRTIFDKNELLLLCLLSFSFLRKKRVKMWRETEKQHGWVDAQCSSLNTWNSGNRLCKLNSISIDVDFCLWKHLRRNHSKLRTNQLRFRAKCFSRFSSNHNYYWIILHYSMKTERLFRKIIRMSVSLKWLIIHVFLIKWQH